MSTSGHAERGVGAPGVVARVCAGLMSSQDITEPPPADPMPLLVAWLDEAARSGKYEDANAMTLATATREGVPSARVVLCKAIEVEPPGLVFYSNGLSRKGRELASNPVAAGVFYWPHAKRQARVEGAVSRVSGAESDEYFRSRPLVSRIGAVASRQSEAVGSRAELMEQVLRVAREAALRGGVERPAHWGGYRVCIRAVELWSAREGRLHDRVRWERQDGGWKVQRLCP